MNWREQVAQLEHEGDFDIAVFLLEKVIQEHPNEMGAYIIKECNASRDLY